MFRTEFYFLEDRFTSEELNVSDLQEILKSLEYSKQRIQDYAYPDHPSYEFKQQQQAPIEEAMRKVRALIKELTDNS